MYASAVWVVHRLACSYPTARSSRALAALQAASFSELIIRLFNRQPQSLILQQGAQHFALCLLYSSRGRLGDECLAGANGQQVRCYSLCALTWAAWRSLFARLRARSA